MKQIVAVCLFAALSSRAFAQDVTVTAGAYKGCTVQWREEHDVRSRIFAGMLRISKSDLVSHEISYNPPDPWKGTLNTFSGLTWGEVAALERASEDGAPYVVMTIHFFICQRLTPVDGDSYYILTNRPTAISATSAWHLEPGQTFKMEKKNGDMEVKARYKGPLQSRILFPSDTEDRNGLHGPLKFKYFIVATCQQDKCKLWNDVDAPSKNFP